MTENTNIKYVKNICDFCGEKRVLHFYPNYGHFKSFRDVIRGKRICLPQCSNSGAIWQQKKCASQDAPATTAIC